MRGTLMVIVLCLWSTAPVEAGLYNTAEPSEAPSGPIAGPDGVKALSLEQFRQDLMADWISIAIPRPESPKRKDYLQRRDELLAKGRSGSLTVEERVNLSAYQVRLGQFEEAAEVLTPVAGREQRNFMVFANLATANQLAGRLDRAVAYLEQVKDVWPAQWPGLGKEQLRWYGQAETYHLKWLRLRNREAVQQPLGPTRPPDTVDPLFGPLNSPVRFVGDSGHYEPGRLAAAERRKLPAEAVAIVQQLLIWMPIDSQGTRLYWLLGEVLNAQGNIPEAEIVFDDCVGGSRRWNAGELLEHRRALKEVKKTGDQKGELAQVDPNVDGAAKNTGPRTEGQPAGWQWDPWRVVLVGGLAGLVVVGLAWLQVREMRRRRRAGITPRG